MQTLRVLLHGYLVVLVTRGSCVVSSAMYEGIYICRDTGSQRAAQCSLVSRWYYGVLG